MLNTSKSYSLKIAGMGCVKIDRTNSKTEDNTINGDSYTADATTEAAKEALKEAEIEADDLDMIINISLTYEKMMPEPATILQKKLHINDTGIPCLTIHSSDVGFINALDLCSAYFESGRFKTIMIISAEILSTIINKSDDSSKAVRFTDVATATVITNKNPSDSMVYDAIIRSRSFPEDYIALFSMWQFQKQIPFEDRCIKIKTDEFEKHSTELLSEIKTEYSKKCSLKDVKNVLFPSIFGNSINAIFKDMKKCSILNASSEEGYHGSASIPAALYEGVRSGKIARGDKLLLVSVGSGIEAGMMKIVY